MHDEFDGRLFERCGIDRRPGLVDQRGAMSQFTPHGVRDMRDDGRQRQDRNVEGLLHHAAIRRRALRIFRQSVQKFHDRGDRRIEGSAAPDVVSDFCQGLVRVSADGPLHIGQTALIERRGGAPRQVFVHGLPQTLDETKRALHALIGPFKRLLGRGSEHREQACGIGAEFVDQCLRIHAVVLRLGHRDHAARLDFLAVGTQHGAAALAALIDSDLDIGGIEILDTAGFRLAEENLVQHHALGEQVCKRLLEGYLAEFVDDPRPKARIEQVQNRVLDAADVLIDGEPVLNPRIEHRPVVVAARKPQEVPGRIHEGVHGVGFAPRRAAAARTIGMQKFFVFEQRVAAAVRHEVLRQQHRQCIVGYRHGAATRAVNHRYRATPIALPRNPPVPKPPCSLLFTQTPLGQIGGNRIDGCLELQPVINPGIDAAAMLAVPRRPCIEGISLSPNVDDGFDR